MITVILILIDQIIKWAVVQWKPSFNILGDFLKIDYVKNTGMIFGLLEDMNTEFIFISIFLCILLAVFMKKFVPKRTVKERCYMLILSGGIGNLIDRVFRGFVVDYFSLKGLGIFNLSDVYIFVGLILVIIFEIKDIWTDNKDERKDFYRK